ncbi:DUF3800 domain-containing protein [Pedobacter cryophilus]|uniref:DUF3800 domain-containing protein n=1 Tax=Pedobacter cryophilus TaxID=2571271 RepID=A0A4U1C7B2_9SPHI|nr:DUF3800 domain-containing protein [Pedobacter cryophilus]TKC00287.1 DUF3800 domain-containing protein [Pedobacter cryophilus]
MSQIINKYFLFIDESGDHGLVTLDLNFPIFLLCGIVIHQDHYQKVREDFNEIKANFWGNKEVIFHSRDIRKCEKEFQILFDLELKQQFYHQLNQSIINQNYTVIASAIGKEKYIKQYGKLSNDVYELSLSFIIERAVFYLDEQPDPNKELEIVIEKRGPKEDKKLGEHFQRLIARGTGYVSPERLKYLQLKITFRDKKENINGLQLADLLAYPTARYILEPKRANPAFENFADKFYSKNGKKYGLKTFP